MAGPDAAVNWAQVVFAFVVVFGMIGGLAVALKYVAKRGVHMPGMVQASRRLKIVESMSLDIKRRLVIVRCDGEEHLLLLGANQDIVVQSRLSSPPETKGSL